MRAITPLLLVTLLFCPMPLAADGIEISGGASMGLIGTSGGGEAGGAGHVSLHSDFDLRLRLSRTTDNGALTFAIEIDLDELDDSGPPRVPGPDEWGDR